MLIFATIDKCFQCYRIEIHSPTTEINLVVLQKNVNLQTSNVGMKIKSVSNFFFCVSYFAISRNEPNAIE